MQFSCHHGSSGVSSTASTTVIQPGLLTLRPTDLGVELCEGTFNDATIGYTSLRTLRGRV